MKTLIYKDQLARCKIITAVEAVDFKEALETITDTKQKAAMCARLKSQETCRFVYKVNGKKVVGYVTIPHTKEPVPCLIHLRGGSRDFGMLTPSSLLRALVRFAAEGYVVIATQYPGVEGGEGADAFGGPDDIASITALRAILKAITVADTTRIGVKGHSRGGVMAYMLLREVKWVTCAVIGGAPVDQVSKVAERTGWREHQISMWGRSKAETIKRSPIFWVNELPKKTPLLLMHGSADWRVFASQSLRMSAKLCEVAIPHRFILFEGADHSISEYKSEVFRQSLEWFERFLKNGEPLPNLKLHGE